MPSPFPGMDPFLEASAHWPLLQEQFVSCLAESLQPALADRYRLRVGHRGYTVRQTLFTSVAVEEHKEAFLEIRCREADRLATLVELPSPTNRTHAESRRLYLQSRAQAEQAGAHCVELDLALAGSTCLAADLDALPERQYVVSVTRATKPPRFELYGSSLKKRLPRIRMPLAADDRDLIVDLQAVLNRVYDRHLEGKVDYHAALPAHFDSADLAFIKRIIEEHEGR